MGDPLAWLEAGREHLNSLVERRDELARGGSPENRARFLLGIVAALRRRVGKDYPLLCRLSAIECRAEAGFEPIADGITLEETSTVARFRFVQCERSEPPSPRSARSTPRSGWRSWPRPPRHRWW
ncbi:MAG: hypothetical protein GY856_51755 [bacterium]|nr:hypothetical protein [bacterium]